MSDLLHAQQANAALRVALRAHYQGVIPAPANLTAILGSVEDGCNSVKNKIDSIEHCERLIGGIDWARFWDLQNQTPAPNYQFMTIADGLLSINLKAEDAMSFLFVTFEHLTSCTKNLSDVYAVLLNELRPLGLRGVAVNLRKVSGVVRQNYPQHPLSALVDPIFGNDASWLNVAFNIRSKSQHRDATGILTIPVGRDSTEPPYLESSLFPRANMLSRRLDQFCPWLKDQAFQFVEEVSRVLSLCS